MLAGLPPAPSAYNPYKNWDEVQVSAEVRARTASAQRGISREQEHDESALAEEIEVMPRGNAFLEQAPYFTEHVRRYLVNKYGEESGPQWWPHGEDHLRHGTCRSIAQKAAHEGVFGVDQQFGFRRDRSSRTLGTERNRREAQGT